MNDLEFQKKEKTVYSLFSNKVLCVDSIIFYLLSFLFSSFMPYIIKHILFVFWIDVYSFCFALAVTVFDNVTIIISLVVSSQLIISFFSINSPKFYKKKYDYIIIIIELLRFVNLVAEIKKIVKLFLKL